MITKTSHALLSSSFRLMHAQKTQLPYGGSERSRAEKQVLFTSVKNVTLTLAGLYKLHRQDLWQYYRPTRPNIITLITKNTNNIHSCVLIHKIKINLKPLPKHINRGKTNVNKNQQYKQESTEKHN